MNQAVEQVVEELYSAWRFRWPALVIAGCVAVLGWMAVFAMPDRYESSARVFVDTRTALKPVIQGLSIEQDVNAQLNYVRQSLLAGPQLRRLAEQTGVLSATVTNPADQAKILDNLASAVTLDVRGAGENPKDDSAGSIYGIAYRDKDRARSLRVVETLLNTLVEETLAGKQKGSESAQKFLESQIKIYEARLSDAENKLADFKKRNVGLMPTDQAQNGGGGGYFAQLQTEMDSAKKAETDLGIAQAKRAELARQLRGEAVVSAAGSTPVIGATGLSSGTDTVSRIKETQAKLDELLLRFTDKHPDVIATRETLAELQKRREAEIEGLKRGDANAVAASGAGSNPVFQSIQLQLNQADVEIASLRGQVEQHRAKAAELRQRLDTAPKVEAEYAQLMRDYDVNKTQYTALLSNYEKARLGEQADSAGSVRFEIVQPPTASFSPVFPRRPLFLAGVLFGALAIGAALAWGMSLLRPVVGTAQSLSKLTGLPVLGVVSVAFPARVHAETRATMFRFAAGVGFLMFAFVVAVFLSRAGLRIALHAAGGG
jgi:polysaccharide chain length determinant protein (PEP-CTERM system associated)